MAFMQLNVNGHPMGWLTFEFFDSHCPRAAHNFRMLCAGECGYSRVTGKPLSYKGTKLTKIIPGYLIQGGDILNHDGTSGFSVYGTQLFSEDFRSTEVKNLLPHDRAGLLCTATLGTITTNSSPFYITVGPCHWQNGRDLVFGEVCGGFNLLSKLSGFGSFPRGAPLADIIISHSGILSSLLVELEPSSHSFDQVEYIEKEESSESTTIKKNSQFTTATIRDDLHPEHERTEI